VILEKLDGGGLGMHDELESRVWLSVQAACDKAALAQLIENAVASFQRIPGYDPLVRLHASDIGPLGLQLLRDALKLRSLDTCISDSYVELRYRLKIHLRDQLQWHLVQTGRAVDEMKEDQLAKDLGL
jgi:hypothetical protein